MKKEQNLAVQISVRSVDVFNNFIKYWNNISVYHDFYVATDNYSCYRQLSKNDSISPYCKNFFVDIFEKNNTDVELMFSQMSKTSLDYNYIFHIQIDFFSDEELVFDMKNYLVHNFLGSNEYFNKLINNFQNNNHLGLISPFAHPCKLQKKYDHVAMEALKKILCFYGIEELDGLFRDPITCNSFIMRCKTFYNICEYFNNDHLDTKEFTSLLLSGYIEQVWRIATENNSNYVERHNCYEAFSSSRSYDNNCFVIYVHYSKDIDISKEDLVSLNKLVDSFKNVIFVTNSILSTESIRKIKSLVIDIMFRNNFGYDFGAWKEALLKYKDQYMDKKFLLLVNNSCSIPLWGFDQLRSLFANSNFDFWGISEYPEQEDGSWLGISSIDKHLQSYCLAFRNNVFLSDTFVQFWKDYKPANRYEYAIVNGEIGLSLHLQQAGYKYGVLVNHSSKFNDIFANTGPQVYFPTAYLLLGSPFLKKKCKGKLSHAEIFKLANIFIDYGLNSVDGCYKDYTKSKFSDKFISIIENKKLTDNKLEYNFLAELASIEDEVNNYKQVVGCYLNKIHELNNVINDLSNEIDLEKFKYSNVVNSKSWKITRPIRLINNTLKKIKLKLGIK